MPGFLMASYEVELMETILAQSIYIAVPTLMASYEVELMETTIH